MAKFNDQIELSIEDMALIERALRHEKRALANRALDTDTSEMANGDEDDDAVRQIHDLLGRLHNQKVFYRPKGDVYVGG